ncbi:MAG: FKBP-type peptidyl-prolyl cis-trans isomerase [Rhodothermales bacterium]
MRCFYSHSALLLCLLLGIFLWVRCDSNDQEEDLVITDLILGQGEVAEENKVVTLNYTGRLLATGEIFDSSAERGPLVFQLETGVLVNDPEQRTVIDGLIEGVPGMRVGGLRRLAIPPRLAFGSRGAGCNPDDPNDCIIPPNAHLQFDLELLDVVELPN